MLQCDVLERSSACAIPLRHEAQAQLQLALLGVPSETMERSNAGPKSFDFPCVWPRKQLKTLPKHH